MLTLVGLAAVTVVAGGIMLMRLPSRSAGTSAVTSPDPQASQATGAETSAPPAAAASDPIDLDISTVLTRVNAFAKRVNAVDWNVDLKAASLEDGIEPSFAYVRDRIDFDAYAGVLRGASGTYTARAGNAADRAVLLARLLERKQIRTRFALGALSPQQCQRLLLRAFETDSKTPAFPPASNTGERFYDRLLLRADRDYRSVRAALGDRLPPVTRPSTAELIAEMNPHIWLQAESAGQWIDLDPTFRDTSIGQTLTTPEQVLSELPAHVYQRITIRVIAEHLADSALRETPLLDVKRNAVDVIDAQVALTHLKPASMGGLGSAIANAFGGRADEYWTPLLLIHGAPTTGERLKVNDPALVAEWLEFTIDWPGGRTEVVRRPLVDRAGAAWRRASPLDPSRLRPLERDEQGPFDLRALHNVWLSGGRHDLADFADALQQLTLLSVSELLDSAGNAGTSAPNDDPGRAAWPFAVQNFTWMVWTDHVAIPMVNDTPGVRLYPDGPRIALFTSRPDVSGQVSSATDLRRDGLRGIASTPALAATVAEKKLRFGVMQGALEQEGLMLITRAMGGDGTLVESTSSAMTAATVSVFQAGASAADLPTDANPESMAGILGAVSSGDIVVAPHEGLMTRPAWWQIQASTGDVAAVAHDGLNSGYGPKLVAKNPLYVRPTPQQNPYGGQKTYDLRDPTEKGKEAYDARRAGQVERATKEAEQYNKGLSEPKPQPKGGGNEYGVLVTVVTVLGGIAFKILGVVSWIMITAGIEELIFQMASGG
ncbi:MAG: hypothetical protein ABIS06_01420 [Vicinamibacterales bacterium]